MGSWKTSKIARLINQNLRSILLVLGIIVFIYIIARVLNYIESSTLRGGENTIINEQEQVSFLTEDVIDKEVAKSNKGILNTFIDACNNSDAETAYGLLSDECKQEFYKSVDVFNKYYIQKNFSTPRTYELQAVAMEGKSYIYLLSLEDDVMVTGSVNENNTVNDYITLTTNDKINLHGFIVKKSINKNNSKNGITVNVKEEKVYMDYEEYTFVVNNETSSSIMMDSKESLISTYLLNNQEVKYSAYIDEVFDQDIIVTPNSSKEITIKFNKMYNSDNIAEKIVFSDIVQNYEEYIQRINYNKVNIEIEL